MKRGKSPSFARTPVLAASLMSLLGLSAQGAAPVTPTPPGNADAIGNIQHVIVIYQENWTFDALYGSLPGANGIANASTTSVTQLDKLTGHPLSTEIGAGTYNDPANAVVVDDPPEPLSNSYAAGTKLDPTFLSGGSLKSGLNTLLPWSLPSIVGVDTTTLPPAAIYSGETYPSTQPFFDGAQIVDPTYVTGDIYHRYWQEQSQIDNGNMDLFVSWSDDPGLVMSHFDATNLPEGLLAQEYTINDNFFHSAFGGSFLNHQFLICGRPLVYPTAPFSIISAVDPKTGALKLYGTDSSVALTGLSTTTGSKTVTVASTIGLYAGMGITDSGSNIPAGATITALTSGTGVAGNETQFTISAAATGTGSAETGTATPFLPTNQYGKLINDSKVTGIGTPSITIPSKTYDAQYAVNTIYSINLVPSGTGAAGAPALGASVLPSANDSNPANTTLPFYLNIGDLLSQKNVSWKWYSGGYNLMLQYSYSNPTPGSATAFAMANASMQVQWHHQPLAYFDNYAPFGTGTVPVSFVGGFAGVGTAGLTANQNNVTQAMNSAAHLQDETNFFADVSSGTLPAVCFIKPVGVNNEHPGYSALQMGQNHVASIVQAVQSNPALWAHTAIIVTYDEHGGRWDHVSPFTRDIWGPGERVPCLVISPYAQKGYVDHTQHDTSAILTTIEKTFNLNTLSAAAVAAGGSATDPDATQVDANDTTLFNTLTSLSVNRSSVSVDSAIGGYSQTLTITNIGSSPLAAPVSIVLDNLGASTSVVNADGTTVNNPPYGSPYKSYNGTLAPGASASITFQFVVQGSGGLSFTNRTVAGALP